MSSKKKKLPEGWAKVLAPSISDVIMGQSPPGSTYNDKGEGLPFFQGKAEFGEIYPEERKWCTEPKKIAQPGDVLLSIRAPVGPTNVANKECAIGRGLAVIRPLDDIPTKYILYSLRFKEHEIATWGTGSTFTAINRKHIDDINIDLPPLAEQKRIVDVIEKLFVRVNKAKEQLENAAETMKRFRKSVLNASCTGKLTEDWREQNNTKDWTNTSVKEVTTKIQYGYTASSEKNVEGPRFLRITDIQKGKVNWDDVPSCKIDKRHIMKYQLETGDIVFARTGATTGKSFLIKECPLSIFASYLIRVKPDKKKILPDYLYIFFQSDSYWEQITGKISGSAQPNCNATKLSSLQLVLPSLSEQKEIAERVDRLFEFADNVEERITEAREKVVRLTQSILAKAFRGELVPTEAELARIEGRDYETAKGLLARVAKAKAAEANDKEKKKMKEQFTVKHKKQPARRPLVDVIYENPKGITPEKLLRIANYTIEEIDDFYCDLSNIMQEIEDIKPSGSQAKKWPTHNKVLIKPKKV